MNLDNLSKIPEVLQDKDYLFNYEKMAKDRKYGIRKYS